jgi:hypothetical protein
LDKTNQEIIFYHLVHLTLLERLSHKILFEINFHESCWNEWGNPTNLF